MSCCSDVIEPIKASHRCTPKDTAARDAQAMWTSGCGCAPVVEDAERLKLVGVVTERDVCCGVAADDRHASDVRVEEIMRPGLRQGGSVDSEGVKHEREENREGEWWQVVR
jgi:predicted transcriptional regulator